MPELPEVEVVRRGLAAHVTGAQIREIRVLHPREIRREDGGEAALDALAGARIQAVVRRGKFLWLALDRPVALVGHLGMSGQVLVNAPQSQLPRHTRLVIDTDSGVRLDIVDQRMFGCWWTSPVVPTDDAAPAGTGSDSVLLPEAVAHVARDALDPALDVAAAARLARTKARPIKAVLLDQQIVSGIGNIYADETLFAAGIHPAKRARRLTQTQMEGLYRTAGQVMREALAQGGTSFDALYVDVAGHPGYFQRSLVAYGRAGQPCVRCSTPLTYVVVAQRGSHICPQCQPFGRRRKDPGRHLVTIELMNSTLDTKIDPPVRVMIIDDHEIVRRGIAEIVDRTDGLEVVAEAGSVDDALRRAVLVRPDVVLVDLQLPDGTGIEVMQRMREDLPQARPIVLTSFDDDGALSEALAAGARAFVLKTVRGAEITDVIKAVADGRVLLDERTVTRRRADHEDPTADLTPSERRVLGLIGDGLSNREIGERLGVAEKTVKNHITSLMSKMGLQRRTQVAAWVAGQRSVAWRENEKKQS